MKRKSFLQYVFVFFITLSMVILGWYIVAVQTQALVEINIIAYQQSELEIVRATARSIDIFIQDQIENHERTNIETLEREIFSLFIHPIHLLENGNAWVYAPDNFVVASPNEYFGKNIAEFFEHQDVNGAKHFTEMMLALTEAREGVGWYIRIPEKGKEIAAWTPVQVGENIWMIGVSTPLSEILESTGATEQIRILEIDMGIITLILLLTFLVWLLNAIRLQKANKSLVESEDRYRRLFDSAPDSVSILDEEGRIIECSQSTAELYGYAHPKALIGKKMTALLTPDSLRLFQEKMYMLEALEATEGEFQILKPDGSVVDIWRKRFPVTDAQGKFSGVLSYDRDISKRLQAEKALLAEREQLFSIFDSIDEMVYVSDIESYEILYVNRAMQDAFQKELVGGICYREFHDFETPCEFCTNKIIVEKKPAPHRWKYHNAALKKDYAIVDRIIRWSDGRDVRFELATDITKQIEAERGQQKALMESLQATLALQKFGDELEMRVEERTIELAKINEILRIEIVERKQVEEALKASKLFAENLVETANIMVITLNTNGNIQSFNRYAEELTGYRKAEVIGENWFDIFIPERDKAAISNLFQETLKDTPEPSQYENHITLKNGQERLINWHNNAVLSNLGNISSVLSIGMDITERMQAEKKLQESEERYRLLADNTSDFIWVTDLETLAITYSSPAVEEMLGFTPDEIVFRPLAERFAPNSVKKIWRILEEELAKNSEGANPERTRVIEAEAYHKKGHTVWIETTARFLYNEDGLPNALMGAARDITERKKADQALRHQATTDPLTQIFNRRHFFDLAYQELERSQRYDRPLSIIMFDIDHFKEVNDTYGHAAGDEVLLKLSSRSAEILRENDIFARYGGEEFVVLLPETDLEQAYQMAERMRKDCAETPLDLKLASVNLTISFGVANLGGEKLLLDELLLRADKALYDAKKAGRNQVSVWGK